MGVWSAELYVDIAKFIIDGIQNGDRDAASHQTVADWLYDNRITVTIGSVRVHLCALKRAARLLFQLRTGTYKECRDTVQSCFKSKIVDNFDKNHFKVLFELGKAIHETVLTRGKPTKEAVSQIGDANGDNE
jgi:hypothetical protein